MICNPDSSNFEDVWGAFGDDPWGAGENLISEEVWRKGLAQAEAATKGSRIVATPEETRAFMEKIGRGEMTVEEIEAWMIEHSANRPGDPESGAP
ncbi:hypothetical protein QN224_14250 [Sinorhizobium sp. 8-89]|uniref:hypothetical protein n=1 Tax=Sinorhizobium sp. 7-81 TaxID=3049087 RepID=UPI0024C3822A|nr:hypothetical protein [Sinorhizobium sp. 7-81]MDK1386569.1 hypothetical protein [Sinorhizobium sp. 7-81]